MSARPDFDNATLWDVRRDVVVFDEHFRPEKTLPTGRKIPARDFKKADLEKIARNCNDRDTKGLPAALVLGHTTDDDSEKAQPEIVGYDRNFRVEWSEQLGKNVIKADRYLRREKAREAEQYPRTSVEHWINQDFLDPIALVKRTPKLDIPQWHYTSRKGELVERYSMESDMANDPTSAPDAAAPNPELEAAMMKCVMACLQKPEVQKMLAGGQAMPSPTNVAAPDAQPYTADGDVERFASDAEKIRYTRQQTEIDRQKAELADLKTRHAREKAEAKVKQLLYEGFDLGGADEKERNVRAEKMVQKFTRLSAEEAAEYEAEIRECYQRAPVGGDMLRTYEPDSQNRNVRRPDELSEEDLDAALKHQRRTGEKSFDVALKHVREKRTA